MGRKGSADGGVPPAAPERRLSVPRDPGGWRRLAPGVPSGIVLRKEVIQPQVPLRLPCYDLTPVADPTVAGCLPCGLAHRLRVEPTPMV